MQHEIKICMGSSCFARGNAENLELIENYIKENKLDSKIELIGARCKEDCAKGPNIFIDNKEYNNITKTQLEKLLKDL